MTTVDHIFSAANVDAGARDDGATIGQTLDRRSVRWGALFVALVILLAAVVSFLGIRAQINQVRHDVNLRLATVVGARAEIIESWAAGIQRQALPVADGYLIRLYANEMDMVGRDRSQPLAPDPAAANAELTSQRSHFDQMLREVSRSTDFASASLVGRDGHVYAADPFATDLSAERRAAAQTAIVTGVAHFGAVRTAPASPAGPEIDYVVPVMPPQSESAQPVAVAALIFALPIGPAIRDFLATGPTNRGPGKWRLFQSGENNLIELGTDQATPVAEIGLITDLADANAYAPPPRTSIGGSQPVYASAIFVTTPRWWLAHELPKDVAEASLRSFIAAVTAVASLAVVIVLAAFGATLYRYRAAHDRSVADQFRTLADRLASQRQLLGSITDALTDAIGLKDERGRYVFVNPAFARAVGRPIDDIMGLDDAAIYGHGTAQRLHRWDQVVRNGNAPLTAQEEVFLASRRHVLQISKIPCRLPTSQNIGILSVSRDISEVIEQQRLRERAQRQTVAALVHAVELRDRHLAGHSRRMAELACQVTKVLGAPQDVEDTVDAAANLSQIGKLGVRRELLTKKKRLTAPEIQEMEKHVDYAADILRGIEFELPVLEAIVQMNERLDGSGYPVGLEGDDIAPAARILAVCDVFCARIETRAYRPAISPAEAIEVLANNCLRYDPEVVRALREVINTVAGEKLLASVEA